MNRKLATLLIIGFFVGFPLAGLIFVYKYAHVNIEKSSELAARQLAVDVLKRGSSKSLEEVGTLELRKSEAPEQFVIKEKMLGNFHTLDNLKSVGSYVGERGDTIWQMVRFEGDAVFSNGKSRLKMTLARRAINREWLIESFQLN